MWEEAFFRLNGLCLIFIYICKINGRSSGMLLRYRWNLDSYFAAMTRYIYYKDASGLIF